MRKKFKKVVRKIPRALLALTVISSFIFSYFTPLMKVNAATHGSGDYYLKLDFTNNDEYTIQSATINGEAWVLNDEYHTDNEEYHIEVVVVENETTGAVTPNLYYGGNWNDYGTIAQFHNGSSHQFVIDIHNDEHQTFLALTIEKQPEIDPNQGQGENPNPGQGENPDPNQGQGENPNPGQGGDPIGPHFDGNAFILWSCKSGGICMFHFDNIPNYDDGNSTFYAASSIVDQRTGERFDVDAKYKGWTTDERFDAWVSAYKTYKNISEINWANVDPNDMLGLPIDMRQYEDAAIKAGACNKNTMDQETFEGCVDTYVATQGVWASRVQLQPVGEPDANNAYVSYGDRNFKVVVYNDEYRGVSIGDLTELEYYPDYMTNPFIRQDQFDISDTTKDKPTGINTVLLEKVVRIKAISSVNDFTITKLEALDVPENAVSITKVNDEWRLEFSSNFYDMVVFKATGNDGKDYYFQVKRTTIDGWIRMIDNKPVINADFWFDKERSYEDFELTAKIYYKDGSTKTVKLAAVKDIDDGLGNITREYEANDGKGLKKSTFQYKLSEGEDKKIKTIYFNAEYKGSTASKYAGAYVGSGEGVKANLYEGDE